MTRDDAILPLQIFVNCQSSCQKLFWVKTSKLLTNTFDWLLYATEDWTDWILIYESWVKLMPQFACTTDGEVYEYSTFDFVQDMNKQELWSV